mmetsp:Transcript_18865/g.37901  ORF Transcript_18865/g.37901 Transcript_18865/m.37901 type:complete len:363 (-) Transcript_18865:997-2085(-)
MAVMTFTSYVLYSYIVLPLTYKLLTVVYDKRYEICPLVKCLKPLATCLREPACQRWVNQVAECSDATSMARQRSAITFAHVQHPQDPAYCRYQSFDSLETATALGFLECIGRSGCLAPADFSDTCADLHSIAPQVLSMGITVPPEVLQGTWHKLYTTGWDLWPCQWTHFWPPTAQFSGSPEEDRTMPSPDTWMKHWPNDSNTWRMDLYWQNVFSTKKKDDDDEEEVQAPFTFHMNNEMYLGETWDFSSVVTNSPFTATTTATLKTRAVMWGTEAHENWYLLDYHPSWQTMLVYYCAYTPAVDRFDSMTMVLQKQQQQQPSNGNENDSTMLTEEQGAYFKLRARELLGEYHGNLQRIPSCHHN